MMHGPLWPFLPLGLLAIGLGGVTCESPRAGAGPTSPGADAAGPGRMDGPGRSATEDPATVQSRDGGVPTPGTDADPPGRPDDGAQDATPVGPRCGNGVLELNETCDGTCPTTCPAHGCNVFTLQGTAATCDSRCIESGKVTSCATGDGCCPPGCSAASDADCNPMCGNGVLEHGETCDPASQCLSRQAACTSDRNNVRNASGNAALCTFECQDSPRSCGPSDGHCPTGCTPGQDVDCKQAGGVACSSPGDCLSNACVDGACCSQSCETCQSCTGPGGTCTNIADGSPDTVPAGACGGLSACDGQGRCQPRCTGPGTLMCASDQGQMTCGRTSWGFEDSALPLGISFYSVPEGAASPLMLTTARASSGSRSVTRSIPEDTHASVAVEVCGDGNFSAPLRNRTASAYYYLDRSGPLVDSSYLRIEAMGYNSAGAWGIIDGTQAMPAIRQWTKMSVSWQDHGTRGVRIGVALYTGRGPTAPTILYIDDIRIE